MKDVAIRPLSDVDVLYLLPEDTVRRFMKRVGNQPSQLLQEVKTCLEKTFPDTPMNADGQVVVLDFHTVKFEVVPVFISQDGMVYYCNSNDGGSFHACNPKAELDYINSHDQSFNGKARHLIRLIKGWKRENNVDLKSAAIEILCCAFLRQWQHNAHGIFYYDWMVRDYFEFMQKYVDGTFIIPGTSETLSLGDSWIYKAQRAHKIALAACEYERDDKGSDARGEWSKIFGSRFPLSLLLSALLGKAA
jgi:hypothetical protein